MQYLPQASEDPSRFLPLLVVLSLAFLVPVILARFQRVPVVVGEILAGVLVGPVVLGWVSGETPILTFMADIGLAFLMFLAGLEIDLDKLFPRGGRSVGGEEPRLTLQALWVYILTLALAIPGAFLLTRLGLAGDIWLIAFVLSATSLGVVLPILKERGMLSDRLGQLVFLTATLADFVTVVLLTIYIITFDRGFDLEILSIGLLFLAFLIVYRFGPGLVRIPGVRRFFDELSRATVQIKVRGAIAILIAFVVLAEIVDAELILGAFLAGMIISLLKGPEDDVLVHKLEAFGFGFFIPVFFVMVGATLDLQAAFRSPESVLSLPEFFLVALAVKVVPMLTLKRWYSWRELFGGGILLNTHLSLEIAVAVIGMRTGLLSAATGTTLILFAILTVVTMPLIFGAILPAVLHAGRRFMLMVGVNDLGIKVAQELRAHGDEVRFLEQDAMLVQLARDAGFATIDGPPTYEGLEQIDLDDVQTVLALDSDEANNLAVACQAKSMGQNNVVAWVEDPAHLPDFQRLGVKPFSPAIQRITLITMMARNPDTFTLLTSTADDREITELRVRNHALDGIAMRDLRLPGDHLILAVHREGELIVPHGNTTIEYGDRLTIVGSIEGMQEIRDRLEGRAISTFGVN